MKSLSKTIRQLCCLMLSALIWSHAQSDDKPEACYLPVKSDVSYKDVTSLAVSTPTVVLKYGDDPLQFGELWLPKNKPLRRAPLLVFIHGGCWLNAYDIKHTHALSSALASAGYAVWSIEYRRTGDAGGGWPGSLNDIVKALDHLGKLDDYPVDLNRVSLIGHSAGGHLALLAAQHSEQNVQAVIGLAAIVDIEQYSLGENSCQTATPSFMGGTASEKPRQYELANPLRQARHPNTILIHGDADKIVPLAQSLDYSKSTIMVAGAGHFDMVHPGTKAFRALLKELASIYP